MWLESLSRGNSWCSRNRRGKYLESFTSSEKYKAQTSHVSTFNTYIHVWKNMSLFLRRESVGCFWCWGGIQKSLLMVRSDVEIENENLPFLYKLVGTWAFSPHPKYDQINKIDDFKERLFPHDMVLFSKKYFEEKKDWRSSSYLFQDSGVPFSPGSDPSTRTRLTRKYFIRFDPAPFLDLHTKWCLEQCNTWYLVRDAHLGKHT